MPTLNIVEIVGEPRPWTAKQGPAAGQEFLSYRVKDDQGTLYEINKKAGSGSPPDLGPNDYEIKPPPEGTNYPPKIKRVFTGGSGGGRGRSPAEVKAIQRQHSQEMALRLLAAFEPRVEGRTAKTYLPLVKALTDWFENDIGGGGASPPAQQPAAPSGLDLPPADTRDLAPIGAAPDDIPF